MTKTKFESGATVHWFTNRGGRMAHSWGTVKQVEGGTAKIRMSTGGLAYIDVKRLRAGKGKK